MNKEIFIMGILMFLVGLGSLFLYTSGEYEINKIEPCVDGINGKIISHNILCEHIYEKNNVHPIFEVMGYIFPCFGALFIMGGSLMNDR